MIKITAILFSLLLISSCSSTEETQKKDKTTHTATLKKVKKLKDTRYKNDPLVEAYDVNQDGKADMWKIYKNIKENDDTVKVLVRREIDINFDGKVNYYKFYSKKGNILLEYLDMNLDGIVDKIRYYESNSLIKEEEFTQNPLNKDLTINKKIPPSKRILYSNKKLSRIISDRNGNGKLDEYLFFRNNKLIEIGFDEDYDEKIDIRVRPSKKKENPKTKTKGKNNNESK